MKIRIERDAFAESSSWVLRSVGTRATLPVLGGVFSAADRAQIDHRNAREAFPRLGA